MRILIPVPREQQLLKDEASIRSRALPVNSPGPIAADHLAILEFLDDSLEAHRKAIIAHRVAGRPIHSQNHQEIHNGLHQVKLYHLDRLQQILSI